MQNKQTREKRTPISVSLNARGMRALWILQQLRGGARASDIVNDALCDKAAHISKTAKERLEELYAQSENKQITELQEQVQQLTAEIDALTRLHWPWPRPKT